MGCRLLTEGDCNRIFLFEGQDLKLAGMYIGDILGNLSLVSYKRI